MIARVAIDGDDPCAWSAGECDPVKLAAQRHRGFVLERDVVRQAIEARTNPVDVTIEECACFVEVALQRQCDDHRAARAADPQRQASRAGMTTHFELRADVFKTYGACLRRQLGNVRFILDPQASCPPS